ncbi:MAG TPA: V-type ATP synthase subunit D [Kofleriaceae bacterium]|nr:V-type ATP synthase subunit D [Kofleriaceae bacterium]
MTARAAPTRAELLRARHLLERVDHGAGLLRKKREALVRALVPLARPAAEARRAIAETAAAAYRAELDALAVDGAGNVAATGWPPRAIEVELDIDRMWGAAVPLLRELPAWERGLAARGTAPGPTGPALVEAASRFEALLGQLLDAVGREARVRAVGAALSRASRQLHTLEQRVAPELAARIAGATRALDERDREDQTRLRNLRGKATRPAGRR